MTFIKCSHRILLAAIMVAPGLALVPQFAFGEGGGRVLKPEAKPHGYSLTDMASAITLFSTSGNSSAYYPNTPFQILSEDTSTVVVTPESGGIVVTATNSFTVTSGTQFFVALYYADDSPVVIGTFPTDECSAAAYIFDQAQVGAKDLEIIVDGESTCLGRDYVAGPVLTAPLLDGGGTHFISVGAFLTPLSVGTHTVKIKGTISGDAWVVANGLSFEKAEFTYQVTVVHRN